jgi:putative tryptophan/tyrosine transport system substrate-binding protein
MRILFGLTLITAVMSLVNGKAHGEQKTVAISQLVEHADLNKVRLGAMEALKRLGFADIHVVYENAQGDVATAVQIAKRFVSLAPDLIIVIGTPAAQAVVRSTKDIPIVFGGIGDPIGAGLVATLEHPGGNATGTRSFTPVEPLLDLLQDTMPGARRIGVLSNPAEANSRAAVDSFIKAGEARGFKIVQRSVVASSETLSAASALVGFVDAIYVPTDNTVTASLESVIKVSFSSKLPVFTAETGGVRRGAMASVGLDWAAVGEDTGRMAARVLSGEKPGDIPVQSTQDVSLRLNEATARALGVDISKPVLARAVEVIR